MNLLNDIHIYLIHEGDLINDSGLPVVQTILILENLMQIHTGIQKFLFVSR